MAFRRIPLFGKTLFGNRRFAVVIVSFSLIAYVLFFLNPSERQKLITFEYTQSTIVAPECPCNYTDKQARAIVTSSARTIPSAGNVAYNRPSLPPGSLNVHVWSEICGTRVDNLRISAHFPYLPYKKYTLSDFYTVKSLDITNGGERIFGFVHPRLSGELSLPLSRMALQSCG